VDQESVVGTWTRRTLLVSLPEVLLWISGPEEHFGKFTRRLVGKFTGRVLWISGPEENYW